MNQDAVVRESMPPLAIVGFAWSIISPLALQPLLSIVHERLVDSTINPTAANVVRFVTGSYLTFRIVLCLCAVLALFIAIICSRTTVRKSTVFALATALSVGSVTLLISAFLTFSLVASR